MPHASFRVGDFTCHILRDGSRSVGAMTVGSPHRFLFGDAPEIEIDKALRPYGGVAGDTLLPFNCLLAEKDGYVTLIDTGCGEQAENDRNLSEPAGMLVESLGKAGFSLEDVDIVLVSHWHWDHFGGAVSAGKPVFPRAGYVMSAREAEYIRSNGEPWANEYIRAISGKLRRTGEREQVCPGVSFRVIPGHTPGIAVAELESEGKSLVYTSDIVIHQVHVEHPDWVPSFETDKSAATTGRCSLIVDAFRRKLLLFVPHIPGVLGRVTSDGLGYKWVDGA